MIEGEIDKETKELKLQFINIDDKTFVEKEINVTGILSMEELIEKIQSEEYPKNSYIKINLVGNKNTEIDLLGILKSIENPNIIKIKDNTEMEINLESIANQNNLKGIFVKKLLEKQEKEPENKTIIQKAIEIGLNAFN